MRTYQRRLPRLCVERALHQVARGRLPLCSRCDHPVAAHAFDEDGRRVCTRGVGFVSCRACAHAQALMAEPARAMFNLAEALGLAPCAGSWQPLVLSP